ncbi:MAG TPA: sugar phosphate isomerase/epimerase [Solirubrobacteraceae bacterium]
MRVGVVMEAFADWPLADALDWLSAHAPEVSDLEIIAGGYGPTGHCDRDALLGDAERRQRWIADIEGRGLRVAALNAWGNPLHPDPKVAARQDADLRATIRLAAELGIDRVVAMAGCPGAGPNDRDVPHFAAGAWLPDLEHVTEWQWEAAVLPYWSALASFAHAEHPDLLVCLELHPGTVVNNVETFERLAEVGANIAANIDPSHFFWQRMDAFAIIDRLGPRVGHAHAKDVAFNAEQLALNGLLDRRWPAPPEQMPWNFASVGDGHDAGWWHEFMARIAASGRAATLAIEHEDPFTPATDGVPAAARILAAGIP